MEDICAPLIYLFFWNIKLIVDESMWGDVINGSLQPPQGSKTQFRQTVFLTNLLINCESNVIFIIAF